MDFIFCKLKKLKEHTFNFLQTLKSSMNMDLFFIFCKFKQPKNMRIQFFARLKKLKKDEFNFLQA